MAKMRGTYQVFNATNTVNAGVRSTPIDTGEQKHVALFIENTGANSISVALEVSGETSGPGRNTPPGGNDWYTLLEADLSTPVTATVAAGKRVALNIAPFAPYWLSLVATPSVASQQGTVTAYVQTIL